MEKFNLYNPETKNDFIENYSKNEDTRKSLQFDFQKSSENEKQLGKDLSDFTLTEVEEVAMAIETKSEQSLRKTLNIFALYVDWCILKNIRTNEIGFNYFRVFLKRNKDLSKYVSARKAENLYLNDEEIDIALSRLANKCDQALLLCLYEGIQGAAWHEIRMLQLTDINKDTKEVKLYNKDGSDRIITISDKLINLLEETDIRQTYLLKNNENLKGKYETVEFIDTIYIFRPLLNIYQEEDDVEYDINQPISPSTLNSRFKNIRKYIGLPFVSPTVIYDSGMINKIIELYTNGTIKDLKTISIQQALPNYNLSYMQAYNLKNKINLKLRYGY